MKFQIDETRKQIAIFLPMTTPTGKARVKRPISGQQPEPVATRQQTLELDDYIEWQIAYETSDPDEPSALAKVQFSKGWRTAENTGSNRRGVASCVLSTVWSPAVVEAFRLRKKNETKSEAETF